MGLETLISDVDQTALIRKYGKLIMLQIGMPLFYSHKNCLEFLLICGQSSSTGTKSLTDKGKGVAVL